MILFCIVKPRSLSCIRYRTLIARHLFSAEKARQTRLLPVSCDERGPLLGLCGVTIGKNPESPRIGRLFFFHDSDSGFERDSV